MYCIVFYETILNWSLLLYNYNYVYTIVYFVIGPLLLCKSVLEIKILWLSGVLAGISLITVNTHIRVPSLSRLLNFT